LNNSTHGTEKAKFLCPERAFALIFTGFSHDETLSVVAVRVSNPDRSPVGIHG
jgi:hypothetical protein